jgi:hypothetical protein
LRYRGGASDMFRSYLAYAEALFGEPLPAPLRALPADAVARLPQAFEQPDAQRRARLADLIDAYAARLRAKPHVVVNLLSPRLWPARFRSVRNVLKPSKW